jgi:hypothetical protein
MRVMRKRSSGLLTLRNRVATAIMAAVIAAALALAAAVPVHADWLSRFGLKQAALSPLEAAAERVKIIAATAKGPALAAAVSQEGHWTFVNKLGERFTAASADELKRVVSTLAPNAEAAADSAGPGRLTLLLTEETVFDQRAKLKDLPKGTDLRLSVDDGALPLRIRGDLGRSDPAPALFAEVRPNLLVSVASREQFDEAVWQLNRPLKAATVRVLALEPGGPPALSSTPKLDPASQRPLIDRLDPLRAADSMKTLRGQTAIVVGRADGKLLYVRGSSGPEQSVILADLVRAAAAADVNLVLLQSASGRQPGARNWLWQKAEVAGLDDALARAQLSDLLNVLGTAERPLAITSMPAAEPAAAGRFALTAVADAAPGMLDSVLPVGRAKEAIGSAIDDVMSGVTGRLVITGANLHLQSRDRAAELQGRVVTGVPRGWIELYIGGMLLGILGWRWTSRWWQRLWPPEARADYTSGFGFQAARAARALLMALLYLPLAGIAALPALLLGWLKPSGPAKPASSPPGAKR